MKKILLVVAAVMIIGLCTTGVSSLAQQNPEEIELTYWDIAHYAKPYHETLLAAFNQLYPNIKVDVTLIGWPDYWPKLGVAIAAGTAPDLMAINCSWVPKRVEIDDLLMPLDKYFSNDMGAFLEASYEESVWDGKIYAMPNFQSTVVVFYNKDMFEEAGIKTPTNVQDAWTWDRLVEVARKFAKDLDGDGNPDIWGLIVEQAFEPYQLDPLLQSNGAKILSPDKSTVDGYLNSPKAIEALEFYGNLFNKWQVSPKGAFQTELFGSGKAAMYWAGPWNIATFQENFRDLNWGVMPHPYFEKMITPCGSWHIGINKRTEHPDAAARVIAFYSSWPGIDLNYPLTTYLPVRKATYGMYDKIFGKLPWSIIRDQLMTSAVPRPRHAAWAEMVDIMRTMYEDVMLGENAKKAADGAVDKIEKILQKYN